MPHFFDDPFADICMSCLSNLPGILLFAQKPYVTNLLHQSLTDKLIHQQIVEFRQAVYPQFACN